MKTDEIRTLKVRAPKGSRFLGYVNYDVQDLVITPRTVRCRRERWQLADGSVLLAALPDGVSGSHFGADLRRFLVYQHHHARLPQARLLEQVREFGVVIFAGQIDAILQKEAGQLSAERTAMFMVGVTHSLYIQVVDTGLREYVIRRQINSGTRSATGREARDIMISLMKTCRKVGVSFFAYLGDRLKKKNLIPPLASFVAKTCRNLGPARC